MAFFHTVEFYVILAFVAAAVIIFCGRPEARGAVKTFLVAGELLETEGCQAGNGIAVHVDEQGCLNLFRYGLAGITETGAYSLAVSVAGFDVVIKERTVRGRGEQAVSCARARLDFLAAERYHFRYDVEDSALSTAFYLTLKPGARADRTLEA